MAGKVTAALAERNDILPPGLWYACVAVGLVGGGGSPPPGTWLCMLSPAGWLPRVRDQLWPLTLDYEYGKPLPFFTLQGGWQRKAGLCGDIRWPDFRTVVEWWQKFDCRLSDGGAYFSGTDPEREIPLIKGLSTRQAISKEQKDHLSIYITTINIKLLKIYQVKLLQRHDRGTVHIMSQLPNKFCHTLWICNFINSLMFSVRSFTESYLYDTDNNVQFENTTPINLINLLRILLYWPFLYWLTGVLFSNSTLLSVSDKYDSVNECTQEIIIINNNNNLYFS